MKPYLTLLRPYQYIKNVLLFFPVFFAEKATDGAAMGRVSGGFVAFCALASAVYILNDYRDRAHDRLHPDKRNRPLASGAADARMALLLMVLLAGSAIAAFAWMSPLALGLAVVYVAINAAYSLGLKNHSIVDLSLLSAGYVVRVYVGAALAEVPVSNWIVLMTFLLAFFLGLAKRREDVLLAASGTEVRKSVSGYSLEFINAAMVMMAAVLVVCYISYTTAPDVTGRHHNQQLYLTAFWVIVGIVRYMQTTFVFGASGNPTRALLRDRFLQVVIGGWLLTFAALLYG